MNEHDLVLKEDVFEIVGCAMSVLNGLGCGFAEKVYENAMAFELEERGIAFERQKPFDVMYKGKNVGHYIPDIIVNNQVIVELKTIELIGKNEVVQVLNYLKGTNKRIGIILNFKHTKLEWKRVVF